MLLRYVAGKLCASQQKNPCSGSHFGGSSGHARAGANLPAATWVFTLNNNKVRNREGESAVALQTVKTRRSVGP